MKNNFSFLILIWKMWNDNEMSQQKRHASFLNEIYNLAINVISMSSDDTYQPGAAGVYMYIEIQPDIIVRADIYK
jgi:hypothetical protein